MGSYTSFYIDDFELLCSKSYALDALLVLFREEDRHVDVEEGEEPWDEPHYWEFEYRASVKTVVKRLEILGFTLAAAVQDLKRGCREKAEQLFRELDYESQGDHDEEFVEEVRNLQFSEWCQSVRTIVDHGVSDYDKLRDDEPGIGPLERELLLDGSFFFGDADIRSLLRALLDALLHDAEQVRQDLTSVMNAGYYKADDPITSTRAAALAASNVLASPIIVLTEGRTDAEFLRRSLFLLHPDISGYYHFLDFDAANAAGGAGQLIHLVKGLIGSGILNRIVALLDNDTAASDAIRSLKNVDIPSNVRVLQYPEISLARSYPTIGPTGLVEMDVNGLGGSIELYFGADILSTPTGEFTPVQWKGYNQALRQYQGVLLDKGPLQDSFRAKLVRCERDTTTIDEADWTGIDAILQQLFSAFAT